MAAQDIDYRLYLVTDRDLMAASSLEEAVEAACKGGCTVVQLREKRTPLDEFEAIARSIKKITDAYNVPLIINDEPGIAAAVGAAGVHVGQDDMDIAGVRAIVGPDAIVGVSASSLEEALEAEAQGADYLGVGAMYYTDTKPDAKVVTMEELDAILAAVKIPSVLIGGINATSIPRFTGRGVAGYAVVSAIMAAEDAETASRSLLALIDEDAEA